MSMFLQSLRMDGCNPENGGRGLGGGLVAPCGREGVTATVIGAFVVFLFLFLFKPPLLLARCAPSFCLLVHACPIPLLYLSPSHLHQYSPIRIPPPCPTRLFPFFPSFSTCIHSYTFASFSYHHKNNVDRLQDLDGQEVPSSARTQDSRVQILAQVQSKHPNDPLSNDLLTLSFFHRLSLSPPPPPLKKCLRPVHRLMFLFFHNLVTNCGQGVCGRVLDPFLRNQPIRLCCDSLDSRSDLQLKDPSGQEDHLTLQGCCILGKYSCRRTFGRGRRCDRSDPDL